MLRDSVVVVVVAVVGGEQVAKHFARHGIPDLVISDNGPQFTADEFAEFSRKWDFEHLTSSPGNSKANGKAESGVKTVKRILKKSIRAGTDPYLAILDYRNTPTQGMTTSPAQRLMSRRTKTLLPTTQSLLLPRTINLEVEKKELQQRQQAQAKYYNRSTKDLPSLYEGHSNLATSLGARPKSLQGSTSGHTPLRRTTEQSTAETDNTCEKRLNHQLDPSSQHQNRTWPVQMKREPRQQRLLLTRVMLPLSHTQKW